jgi:hypothetical protein
MRRVFGLHARRQFRVRCIDVDSGASRGASARTVEGCEATARLRRDATPRDEAAALGGGCSLWNEPAWQCRSSPAWPPRAGSPGFRQRYAVGMSS